MILLSSFGYAIKLVSIYSLIYVSINFRLVDRPVVFSLAAAGEAGVRKVFQMLRDDHELTMALSGCRSLEAGDQA